MLVKTSRSFDLEAFRRGYEEWDIDALLALYADEVELIQVDRDNPPSAPRVRHGKEMFKGMFEHCAAAGVKATVENGVAGEHSRRRHRHLRVPGRPQGRRQRDLRARGRAHRPRAASPVGRSEVASRPIACDGRRRCVPQEPPNRRKKMPKASKETASEHETLEGYEGHFEHFADGWTVGFETSPRTRTCPLSSEGFPMTSASARTWAT